MVLADLLSFHLCFKRRPRPQYKKRSGLFSVIGYRSWYTHWSAEDQNLNLQWQVWGWVISLQHMLLHCVSHGDEAFTVAIGLFAWYKWSCCHFIPIHSSTELWMLVAHCNKSDDAVYKVKYPVHFPVGNFRLSAGMCTGNCTLYTWAGLRRKCDRNVQDFLL